MGACPSSWRPRSAPFASSTTCPAPPFSTPSPTSPDFPIEARPGRVLTPWTRIFCAGSKPRGTVSWHARKFTVDCGSACVQGVRTRSGLADDVADVPRPEGRASAKQTLGLVEVAARLEEIGIQREGALKLDRGLAHAALTRQGQAKIVACLCGRRIGDRRLSESIQRSFGLALRGESHPQVVPCLPEARTHGEGAPKRIRSFGQPRRLRRQGEPEI